MTTRISRFAFVLPAVLSLTVAAAQPAGAQTTSVTAQVAENAEERIDLSGKLRMLSQRIPAAVCHLGRGIDPEGSSTLLNDATGQFEKILAALEFGDADLNIQEPETRRKTLAAIAELRSRWEPLKTAADAIATGTATPEDINLVLTQNLTVLAGAQLLVEELVQQYSNPNAVTRASLMLIDISGRQRMLTQKISKESCMLGSEYATPSTLDDLQGTIRIFEASLEALTFGMPAVGIGPPPNPEIYAGLGGVQNDWSTVKPHVLAVIDGKELDDASNTEKFRGLNVTMVNMNRVVGMYTASVK
ncbi:type IV pili methyl-accepting chemotaxis transducer N-terminal domain-containing protein [Yoonia sp.]|uniref:type IV pili methyl-accepting chemotaxis transducer N-terminal domain-containing protein n=1 Tax=Yoonia sp. TaxID=2212373 RepID=UPI0023B37370